MLSGTAPPFADETAGGLAEPELGADLVAAGVGAELVPPEAVLAVTTVLVAELVELVELDGVEELEELEEVVELELEEVEELEELPPEPEDPEDEDEGPVVSAEDARAERT